MQSIYVWKGEVLREKEVLLLAKTTRTNFDELEREVRAVHSYETPEIIALPITAGSQPYLKWLISSCEGS
jgi:periplasmic divalent cation tolerance protein